MTDYFSHLHLENKLLSFLYSNLFLLPSGLFVYIAKGGGLNLLGSCM